MVDMPDNPTKPNPIYLIYMYKEGLALNNLQWLICHKSKLLYIDLRPGRTVKIGNAPV